MRLTCQRDGAWAVPCFGGCPSRGPPSVKGVVGLSASRARILWTGRAGSAGRSGVRCWEDPLPWRTWHSRNWYGAPF